MKKLLILGGTQFIGRNLVERLKGGGEYEITLFNRQQTQANLFQNIKKIKGDRETNDINILTGKNWDCVIDLSCYYPNSLEFLLSILKGRVDRYIFISTISAYQLDSQLTEPIKENFEIHHCELSERTDKSIATYGNRKAECERILQKAKWLDKIILRPSLVYGKYDPTDRFYYWLYKAHNQLPIILPDNGTDKITLTYVSDLVDIIIKSISIQNHSTVYNATTHEPLPLKAVIKSIDQFAQTITISSTDLINKGIKSGQDIPLWFNTPLIINNDQLRKDFDIDLTPFDQSVRETWNYYESLNWPQPKIGLDHKKENEIIYTDDKNAMAK